MAFQLDSFLNFIIPIAVLIFFAAVIFNGIREPLMGFFGWIKSLFSSGVDKLNENKPTDLRGVNISYG